jgi:hypothetical protein
MTTPHGATTITATLAHQINTTRKDIDDRGHVYTGPGRPNSDNYVCFVDLIGVGLVGSFLKHNLMAGRDLLVTRLEADLAADARDKTQAKAVMSTLIGYALNPASAPADLASKGLNTAGDALIDHTTNTAAINQEYDEQIMSINAQIAKVGVSQKVWENMFVHGNVTLAGTAAGLGPPPVETPQLGYSEVNKAHPVRHDGDPRQYIGHPTQTGDGPAVQDDFLAYEDGKISGAIPVHSMNSAQRAAYLHWLRDPAVQLYLSSKMAPDANTQFMADLDYQAP